jgi:RNA polymerase sigma factor (sigma-70 family)
MPETARRFAPALHYVRALAGEPGRLSDGQLLGRFALDRDEGAFGELLRRHGPLVLGVARRRLADRHAAEDVFQATFLELARQAARFRGRVALAGWLYTVASRLACKERARAARRPRPAPDDPSTPAPPGADPLAAVSGRELLAVIDEELARLPGRYRLPLLLCGLEGLARDEAAARLGWSLGALRGCLERGRALLRRRLEARGLTVPAALAGALLTSTAVPLELAAATRRAALAALAAPEALGSVKALVVAAGVLVALGVGAGVAALPGGRPDAPPAQRQSAAPLSAEPVAPRVDREGVPLPPGVLARLGSSRMRHTGSVKAVDLAPDGRTVASASLDSVCAWSAATGRLVRRFDLPGVALLAAVRFAAEGRHLVCVTQPRREAVVLRRLDLATGKELLRVTLDAPGVEVVAFAAGGDRLAVADPGARAVRLYDTTTGAERPRIPVSGRVRSLAFGAGDRTLAVADLSDTVRLYDAGTGRAAGVVKLEGARFMSVALAPDGRSLAAVVSDPGEEKPYQAAVWDLPAGTLRHRVQPIRKSQPFDLAYSPDNRTIALCSPDSAAGLVLWDAAAGRVLHRLPGPTTVICAAFAGDGRTVAGGTNIETLTLWDVASSRRLPASADPPGMVRFLQFVSGRRLVGHSTSTVTWDLDTGRAVSDQPAPAPITTPGGVGVSKVGGKSANLVGVLSASTNSSPRAVMDPDLTPAQEAEAERLFTILKQTSEADLKALARLLASTADRDLLGATEFQVRDRVLRIGAQALETALAERKKRGTTGPAGPVPAAGGRPSSSAGRPSGS